MNINIIEQDFSMTYPLDNYKSFIWTDKYAEYGDFEIYIPITREAQEILKINNFVYCNRSDHLMIIEDIKTESDLDNGNFLIVTGKSLESIPARRIIWHKITFTDEPLQNIVKVLLEKNIIKPDDQSRAISNFIFEESTDERITKIDKVSLTCELGDDLYEKLKELLDPYQIGFKVIPNEKNQFVFSLYLGTDRSYAQETNPWIIFSPKQDNVISARFNESTSEYKNVALVVSEKTTYPEDGGEAIVDTKGLVLGSNTGLSRREIFSDARGIDIEEDTPDKEIYEQMRTEGYKTLADYRYNKDFEGEVDYLRSYQYGTDYYLGDIIEFQDLFGNEGRERVTEFMIKEDTNGFSAYPTLTSIVEDNAGGGYSYELKLGIEHTNAFYGDWGYEAYQHAHTIGNPHKTTWSDVGADEAGAAEDAYNRAKGDAQAAGNQALRNANIYTDNQIKKLTENTTFRDWTSVIDNAVTSGLSQANAYSDKLINDLVGAAPAELDTIYELAEAIKDTSVHDALTEKLTQLDRRKIYSGWCHSGKFIGDLKSVLGLDETPVPLENVLQAIKSQPESALTKTGNMWMISINAQEPNDFINSLFEAGTPGLLFIYSVDRTYGRFLLEYYTQSGNKYTAWYLDTNRFSDWVVYSRTNQRMYSRYPFVMNDGGLEIGKYIDFNFTSGAASDAGARIYQTNASKKTLSVSKNLNVENNLIVGNDINFTSGAASDAGARIYQSNASKKTLSISRNLDVENILSVGNEIRCNGNIYVRMAGVVNGVERTDGWEVIADITVTNTYCDSPITFEVIRRHTDSPSLISVAFKPVTNLDPDVNTFVYSGAECDARIWKTEKSKWRLAIKRSESYDIMLVTRYISSTQYNNDVTWTYAVLKELPESGVRQAVLGGRVAIEINNLKNSVSNLKNSVSNGKKLVADAITKAGVETSATAEFQTMANNITQLSSSGGGDEIPLVIKQFQLVHNDEGNYDGGHSYINAYVTLMWTKDCTISGIVNDKTIYPDHNGGFSANFPELNGTHKAGDTQVISSGGDAAYSQYIATSNYDFTNAKVSYT